MKSISWWKRPTELTIMGWQRRADDGSIWEMSASRNASRNRGLYRRGGVNTRERPAGTAHMDCGPPRGGLELSECLRHCLDEDVVLAGYVVSEEDMATSLSVGGMESEGAGRATLLSSSKFREILARLSPSG